MNEPSLQERYAPNNKCFGCGPANPRGLRIRSFLRGDACVVDWMPEPHHEAFEGALNGGIIGTLLDCHMNWTAAVHLMRRSGLDELPSTVTAEYHVRLLRPTPSQAMVSLEARVVDSRDNRVTVECTLRSGDKVCAGGRGVFVAVPPGHPAYHRW